MTIDRAKLLDGTYDREAKGDGIIRVMTKEEREATRLPMLESLAPDEDLWVFAYGSLIWRPEISIVERRACRAYGLRRSFCMWSPHSRGTPENPGLMLALEPGGSCTGQALRIPAREKDLESQVLWAREMFSGIYRPGWVKLQTDAGPVRAVTFMANRHSPFYWEDLCPKQQVRSLATAEGKSGPNFEYLDLLKKTLDEHKLADRAMRRLHHRVCHYRSRGEIL